MATQGSKLENMHFTYALSIPFTSCNIRRASDRSVATLEHRTMPKGFVSERDLNSRARDL
jgi:hypothetical protein